MKRFLSLKVQTEEVLDLDPYEITTWRPIGPNTPITALPGSIRGQRFQGYWINSAGSDDEGDKVYCWSRKCNTEAMVMALFPPVTRREIRTPTPRKTPNELRRDYLYLEKSIESYENRNTVVLKSPTVSFIHEADCDKCGLLRVESPMFVGDSNPLPATPSGSQEAVTFLPTKALLDLKKPKSGVFINEEELADYDKLESPDPRQAQEHLKNKKKSKFVITEDKGQLYATLDNTDKKKITHGKATQVVTETEQIIRGKTSLLMVCKEARGWHALSVVTTAFVYSKISDPCVWTSGTVGEIIKSGLSFSTKWNEPKIDHLTEGLPLKLDYKGYRIQIDVEPDVYTGELYPALAYICSELCRSITANFNLDNKSKGIIIEIENIVLIVWRKENVFFLFDPFERDECGNDSPEGFACLLLNNNLSDVCHVIYNNLNKLVAPSTKFRLHQIVVTQVDKVMYANIFKDPPLIVEEAKLQGAVSKMSIPPLMGQAVPTVPVSELSNLSLLGKRKVRKAAKIASESLLVKTDDAKPTDPETVNYSDLFGLNSTMKSNEIEAALDSVLDRIQDKIEAKCYKDLDSQKHRARSVLVKSDLGRLQRLRRNIVRGYDDDSCKSQPVDILRYPDPDNLDFRDMPDGSQVMLGTRNLLQVVEYSESISVIAPLLACVLSTKYGIQTWQPACLDFVLNTTRYIQDCVPMAKYQMFRAPNHHFPEIQIGSTRYSASVKLLEIGTFFSMADMLRKSLTQCDRLVISSMVFNAAVFQKNEFWYLFDAFPCDLVGIRCTDISEGVASFQRFKSFDSLVSRIIYNQYVGRLDQSCSVSRVSVKDVTDQSGLVKSFRFVPLPEHKEKETIAKLNKEEQERVERNAQYLDELNQLIRAEKCRIKKFNKKAGIPSPPPVSHRDMLRKKQFGNGDEEEEIEEEEEEEEAEEEKPPAESIYDKILKQPYGYTCIAPHLFYKIQGSACLPYRFRYRADGIRACHFCSMYAMSLVALHCSWDSWSFRTVDQCIEEGRQIYTNLDSVEHLQKRIIDKVPINQKCFKITIEKHEHIIDPLPYEIVRKPSGENRLYNALNKFFDKNRYVLLYFPNTTFAVIKQNCFNIFDPYASYDLRKGENHIVLSRKAANTNTRLFNDNNAASWLCMPSLLKLLQYVRQRVRPRDMNERFELFTVKCIVSDPQPRGTYAHFMLSYALRRSINERPLTFETLAKTLPDEETSWLNVYPSLLPWSRQHIRNSMEKVRYKPTSMWKHFDCEIEGDLYSLFANLHPMCCAFNSAYRGRQYAGIYSIAACITALYPMDEWSPQLMNYIVIEGDRYFQSKMEDITEPEYEVSLEDLTGHVELASFSADIDIEAVVFGQLYSRRSTQFNLKKALLYFFSEPTRSFGVVQCFRKSVAFGRTRQHQYFMLDCMTVGPPVFRAWEGASYLLLCSTLKRLLHCIVLTLRVPCYNVEFHLHEISTIVTPTPDPEEEEEEEEEEEYGVEDQPRKSTVAIKRQSKLVSNPIQIVSKNKK